MLAINPLLPFFPDSISFLIYGLVTGLLLKFWRIAKKHFFFMPFFLVPHFAWVVIMFAFITVQPQERQAWFVFGFALTFIKIFSIIRAPFVFAFEVITEGVQERRANRRDQQRRKQQKQENQSHQERNQQQFQEEQARREAEAKANRAKQSGKKHNEKSQDKTRQEQDAAQNIKPTERQRSYEEILGLQAGWTQDDLKKAYQRVSNCLL